MKVVAIIVTYNRKNLLLHCIDAIYAQCKNLMLYTSLITIQLMEHMFFYTKKG